MHETGIGADAERSRRAVLASNGCGLADMTQARRQVALGLRSLSLKQGGNIAIQGPMQDS